MAAGTTEEWWRQKRARNRRGACSTPSHIARTAVLHPVRQYATILQVSEVGSSPQQHFQLCTKSVAGLGLELAWVLFFDLLLFVLGWVCQRGGLQTDGRGLSFRSVKLLGSSNMQGVVLPQAIGGVEVRSSCLVSSYRGSTTCRVLLCLKLLGNHNLRVFCVVSSVVLPPAWGITICRALLCVKPLGDSNL